jgi:predicted DNA-binding transcriptional regulator YafY
MRSQRLVSCMLLLQGKRHSTARELAAALEVSMRTIYRDIEALSEAGVPIHMERGPWGGIVLADDYRRALAQFTNDELQALFAGAAAGPMRDIGIVSPGRALQKLAGALPAAQRRAAEANQDRLLLDHNKWGRAEQPTAILAKLRAAVASQCRVSMHYRDRSGTTTSRSVAPLGLVAKAGIWYLVAVEAEKGYRTFRAERIAGVLESNERFERPADFNLEAHWNASVASVESKSNSAYSVLLRVRLDMLAVITSFWECAMLSEEAEFSTVRVAFPNRDVALAQILAMGDGLHVLEPDDLPAAIVDYARLVLARYAPEGTGLA